MKYEIAMVRRPSKNNGRNYCKYAVIVEKETNKIVLDDNYRYDKPAHLEKVKNMCNAINKVGDYEKWHNQILENIINQIRES